MQAQDDTRSQRNLKFLVYLGWACQSLGVLAFLGVIIARVSGTQGASVAVGIGAPTLLALGIAIAGWAGNLSEIITLKRRVMDLEARLSNPTDRQ